MSVEVGHTTVVSVRGRRSAPPRSASVRPVVRRGLLDRWRAVLSWGISIGALGAFMAAIYPSIKTTVEDVAKNYPAGLKQAFGVQAMNTVEGYVHAEMQGNSPNTTHRPPTAQPSRPARHRPGASRPAPPHQDQPRRSSPTGSRPSHGTRRRRCRPRSRLATGSSTPPTAPNATRTCSPKSRIPTTAPARPTSCSTTPA